ncbi:DMT family transporter [Planctomicrobium piriforme]|uniref:Transporter family-2 protein n=1 Tax=Planctomicrobium piriforme TaxID=1576369 RepID=A0A1I3CB68_9PLAN|nr:DMT family transporter [Planctomicrobium piriforme]SFH71804.1 transporter family-2 protein [Planctomicrobium piriforme]
MSTLLLMILAALTACGIPIQAIVNARLGTLLANPLLAALISFVTGTLALGIICLIANGGIPKYPSGVHIPAFLYIGGLLGAVFVTVVLVLVPKIGPANVIAATIVGQLVMGLVLDHYGVLGTPQNPVNLVRLSGAALLIVGAWLVKWG